VSKRNWPSSSFGRDLENLKLHNKHLARLIANCANPGYPAQGTQSNPPTRLSLDVLQMNAAHADELFDAICECYRCQCPFPHEVSLRLRLDSHNLQDTNEPFELIFPTKEISEDMLELDPKSPTSLSEILVDSTKEYDMRYDILPTTENPINNKLNCNSSYERSWSRNTSMSPLPPREKRGYLVSFSDTQSSQIDMENTRVIPDLCKFVKDLDDATASPSQNLCLGVLGAKKKYTIQITSVDSVVCLDDYLVASQSWELSRRTRIDLALSLSLVILQFYSTPWLDTWWTWKDFCMLKNEKPQVFINRKFYSTQKSLNALPRQTSHSTSASMFWYIMGEPILTRLGFALVELALGKRLFELRSPNGAEIVDEDMLDFQTAKNAVSSGLILGEAGQLYNDAVKACLDHRVILPSGVVELNSKHQNFQQDLEQFVVAPIRNLRASNWGLTTEINIISNPRSPLEVSKSSIEPNWITYEWEVPEAIDLKRGRGEQQMSVAETLRTTVVLTGYNFNVEATTCEGYMRREWGDLGLELLELIISGIGNSRRSPCEYFHATCTT
jgi:hypothetical protein